MRLAHFRSDVPGEMNRVLRELARALTAEGRQVVGAVQTTEEVADDGPCDMNLLVLPDGPVICISQSLGPGSAGCRLDTDRLEQAVHECEVRLAAGADLLLVNKFGSHEAGGRGFRDLIGTALGQGVPVVVGVTDAKLPDFEAFAGDLAEEVPCDLDALRLWCARSVAKAS